MEPDLKQIAHDLRNHLATIQNYAQVLELMLPKEANKKELEVVREIIDAVRKANSLINERLDQR